MASDDSSGYHERGSSSATGSTTITSGENRHSVRFAPNPSRVPSRESDHDDSSGYNGRGASSATGSSDIPSDTVHIQVDYEGIISDLREGTPYKRLNIMIIGKEGCGKSSLINSLLMSINPGGHTNVVGEAKKKYLASYSILEDFHQSTSKFICQPHVYECPGLPDIEDDNCVMLLKMLLTGQLKYDVNVNEFMKTKQPKIKMKVDKKKMAHVVIVVHSAAEDTFPDNLICNINDAVQSFRAEVADVLVLGVITKKDHVDKRKQTELCKEFAEKIGLQGVEEKIFYTTLYKISSSHLYNKSDDKPKGQRIREIDEVMCDLWYTILRTKPDSPRKERSLLSWLRR